MTTATTPTPWDLLALVERTKARTWWADHITAAYARYGLDWPGPIKAEPVVARVVLCDAGAHMCRCAKDAGHELVGDLVHACDPAVCAGEWTGTYDQLKFNGGSEWEPITMPKKVTR